MLKYHASSEGVQVPCLVGKARSRLPRVKALKKTIKNQKDRCQSGFHGGGRYYFPSWPFVQGDSDALPLINETHSPSPWEVGQPGIPCKLAFGTRLPHCEEAPGCGRRPQVLRKIAPALRVHPMGGISCGFAHEQVRCNAKRRGSLSPAPGPEHLTPSEFTEGSECLWLLIRGPFPPCLTLC